MASNVRVEKVSSAILEEMSDILQYEVKDVRIQNHFASVTKVTVSGDLRHAKIFISVYGGDEAMKKEFMAGLKSAQGYIRSELAQRIQMRFIPELMFVMDSSFEKGSRVLQIIEELRKKGELE